MLRTRVQRSPFPEHTFNAAIADFEPLASERVGRQSFFGIGYNLASLALHRELGIARRRLLPGLGDPLAGLHIRQASVPICTRL
jgi:hypothetical protein